MKRTLSILIALLMLVGAMALNASAASVDTYYAPYGDITIDGKNTDGEWDNAYYVDMSTVLSDMPMLSTPTMKIMHDGTYMYLFIEVMTPNMINDDVFVCVHVPHGDCPVDGCTSYLRFVIDAESRYNTGRSYQPWTYWADPNFDGNTDLTLSPEGDKTDYLVDSVYLEEDGVMYAELCVAANYGNDLTLGEPAYVSVRVDDNNFPPLSAQAWASQPFTWDNSEHWNPTDGGEVIFLAEGEAIPEGVGGSSSSVTPPVAEDTEDETLPDFGDDTEDIYVPQQTEPVEDDDKDTEPTTEPATEKVDDSEDDKGSFPVVPVVIAAVAVIAVIAIVIVLAKKKKNA